MKVIRAAKRGDIKNPKVGRGGMTRFKLSSDASRWKGGYRDWARKNYKKKYCENCHDTQDLQLHHKDKNVFNNHPSNLKTLCRKCHKQEHYSKYEKVCMACGVEFLPTAWHQKYCAPCRPVVKLKRRKIRRKKTNDVRQVRALGPSV